MSERNHSLDYIKGLAIIGVVLIHSTQRISGLNYYISTISHLGQLGCQMFFVVSGYLAAKSLKKCDSTAAFIAKKAKGFTPAWHIMLIVYCTYSLINFNLLGLQIGIRTNTDIVGIVLNALFLNGLSAEYCNSVIPAGWFIGTLMLMYLCTPFVYSTIKDRTRAGETVQKLKIASPKTQHIVTRKLLNHYTLCPKKTGNDYSDSLGGSANIFFFAGCV